MKIYSVMRNYIYYFQFITMINDNKFYDLSLKKNKLCFSS